MYFDAIAYNPLALQQLVSLVGSDRVMFGTDHPFFPPADNNKHDAWPSTVNVQKCIRRLPCAETRDRIRTNNARQVFSLPSLYFSSMST